MLLGRQEETERSHVVFPLYMGRIYSKKAFHGGTLLANLSEENLKVAHWCVNGDVKS